MSVVRASEVIDAPPEEVWKVISDPRNLPRWNSHIKSVHGVPEDGLKEGTQYSTALRILGVPFEVRAEVRRIDPPRFAEIRLTGPVEAEVRTWVRPVGKRRARLEHEVNYRVRGGAAGAVVTQGLRMMGAGTILRRGTRAQKEQVEEG